MYKLGIDTGGTHTDVFMANIESGETYSTKVSTTPDLITGISQGIDKIIGIAGISPQAVEGLIYGTTIVVNMIAQRQLGNTAFITTRGFRDILAIGRAFREKNIYDIQMEKPEPLIKRHLCYEITERIDFRGQVIETVDLEEIRKVARELKKQGVVAVAVCFLHSYVNPAHEQAVRQVIAEEYPGVFVSISSDVNPQFREYERASTTAINAAMMPAMITHLAEFQKMLDDKDMVPKAYVMQANAGVASFGELVKKPVSAANSGPIAGIIASNELAKALGTGNLITFDMGGTSADVSLIQGNAIKFSTDNRVEGYPVSVPAVDLSFIGAGGGSVAWIDAGGALRVGPMSQGSYPGPVCYQRGGNRPTVTDANLVTGRIRPETFLQNLEEAVNLSRQAIKEQIADPLGLDVLEAAEGILQVVNSNMIRAIRNVSVEKGYDPRDFSLIAYGGSGPLHAACLAAELDIPSVIVPFSPGTFSAQGMLMSDSKADFVYSNLILEEQLSPEKLASIIEDLEEPARLKFEREKIAHANRQLMRTCDIRYYGQSFELNIPISSGPITSETLKQLVAQFHETHRRIYGHAMGEPLEFVNYRVSALARLKKFNYLKERQWETQSVKLKDRNAQMFFDGHLQTASICERSSLSPGSAIEGPAIICEMGCTTVIFPGQSGQIDDFNNIVINTQV